MKLSQMKQVITNFIENDDSSCILINGVWGVGKTHTLLFDIVKPYQEENFEHVKFAYSSLFGKNKIDEINTELYSLLHPKTTKIMNLISPVIKIIDSGFSLSGININFNPEKIKPKQKNKKVKNKKTIVILDDLERLNTKYISHKEIMGYINDLITQGIKVVVLANIEQLEESQDYEDYKEKVFDRIYNITSTDIEIYNTITQQNKEYVNKTIIKIIDDNLRILKKANSLFNQIKTYIEKKQFIFNEWSDLFLFCCYTLMDSMSNKYTNIYSKEKSKNIDYYTETQIRIFAFEKYIKNTYYFGTLNCNNYIIAILHVLESEDFSTFDELFNPNIDEINPLFLESIFYMSDEDKLKVIKLQYEYIKKVEELSAIENNSFRNVIKDWYKYCEKLPEFIDETLLFEKLNQFNMKFYKLSDDKNFHKFVDRFDKYNEQKKIKEIILLFEKYPESIEDFDKINKILITKQTITIIKELEILLLKNNFLVKKIHGTMSSRDWELAHNICKFICSDIPNLKNSLSVYLEEYMKKYPNDNSLKERASFLIDYYDLKNTES